MPFGSFGRVYLGGEEQDILAACRAAEAILAGVSGRDPLLLPEEV